MTELSKENRQFVYLSETTHLIRHLAAMAKYAKVRAAAFKDQLPDSANEWMAAGALDAFYTALGGALLDYEGHHHYNAAMAAQKGLDWLQAHEDLIEV